MKFQKFKFFLFFSILPHKITLCQILDFAPKKLTTYKKSPGSAAFVIYISNASVKGETTENWLATGIVSGYFMQLILICSKVKNENEIAVFFNRK